MEDKGKVTGDDEGSAEPEAWACGSSHPPEADWTSGPRWRLPRQAHQKVQRVGGAAEEASETVLK